MPTLPSGAGLAAAPAPIALIHWTESGQACSAQWRSERGAAPPKRVVLADDTTTADSAYRLACEGTALLWRGDFHNARQMLQALKRRIDNVPTRKKRALGKPSDPTAKFPPTAKPSDAFHQYRQAQAQRARILGMVLLPFNGDYSIPLRRAPDARQACAQAWGAVTDAAQGSVATLRDLMGMTSAFEWRRKGVEITALGSAPDNRIHPHYGVFSPVRGEYVGLVASAPLPAGETGAAGLLAFDIGTGTGVLSVMLARRQGIGQIVATDQDPRALACAQANLERMGLAGQVQVMRVDLFPPGRASVVVCNPPWLPARPGSPIEHAVYDEGSQMLLGFLGGLAEHLSPQGEGWLILSDLAEHLGLRSRAELLDAIQHAGLTVLGRMDTRPIHGKAADSRDALHAARAAEVTSLWRLGVSPVAVAVPAP
jgi:hypothetical protein